LATEQGDQDGDLPQVGRGPLALGRAHVGRPADAARDIAHLQLDVKNRTGEVLNFVVLGRQRVGNPADPNPATSDLGLHPEARAMVVPYSKRRGHPTGVRAVRGGNCVRPAGLEDGWALSVPRRDGDRAPGRVLSSRRSCEAGANLPVAGALAAERMPH